MTDQIAGLEKRKTNNLCASMHFSAIFQFRSQPKAEVLLSAENRNRNRKSIVYWPKPSASLMPACQGPQATVPDADVDSAASLIFA